MTRCVNCGRARDDISEVTYWTARLTTRVAPYRGSIERQTESRYEAFRAHTYRVCAGCQRSAKRALAVRLGVFIGLMVMLLLALGVAQFGTGAELALLAGGAAAALAAALLAGGTWRIPRTALADRLRYDPHGRYQVFSETQYQRLCRQTTPAASPDRDQG